MYTNKKRSENDQYNETSNHIQMKGGGGSGRAWDPRGRGDPPLPPYPFICLWFDVSLYWSFSLRFLFVYISFYASNVYLTFMSCYIFHIFIFMFLFILFIFHVLYLFPRYTFWYQGPLLLIVYYPYKWNIAIWQFTFCWWPKPDVFIFFYTWLPHAFPIMKSMD